MLPYAEWRAGFARVWRQGEHVALLGPTGSGKTYTARDVLAIRQYVIVLAVKREDDTLTHFTRGEPKYKKTSKWPVNYDVNRALISLPPESLSDAGQALKVYNVLNGVFKGGGWCIFLDDTGYISSHLKLKRQIAELLNVGRSSGISVVSAATQPSSAYAGVPSETLRQVRHVLIWKFEDDESIEACAHICGMPKRRMHELMDELIMYADGSTDFVAYRRGAGAVIVR
jgi:hypothetical protein